MRVSLLFITLAVLAVGFLPAYALSRDVPVALTLSGAVAMALGGIGGTVCVALGAPLLVGVVPVTVLANAAAVWWIVRTPPSDRRSGDDRIERVAGVSLDALFVAGALFVPALVLLAYKAGPPMGWDPRSIFWFHASWFEHGGAAVKSALDNPYVYFSHPDYPPGPSGLIGSFWKLSGGENLALARDITSVVTALALAGVGWFLMGRRRTLAATVLVAMFLVATPALAGASAPEGYVDMLCAALLVGGFLAFRELPTATAPWVGSALFMAASLTKGEGLFFGVFIALILVVAPGPSRRVTAITAAVAFVPVVVWLGLVRVLSDKPGEVPPGGFIKLAFLRSRELHRFTGAFPDVVREALPYLALALVVVAAATIAHLLEGHRPLVTLPVFMLVVGVVLLPLLTAVYAAGPFDLDWWIRSSVNRVTTASKLLFLGAVVRVLLTAAERERWPVAQKP